MRVTCNKCKTQNIIQTKEYLDSGCYYCPICGADLTKPENITVQPEKLEAK